PVDTAGARAMHGQFIRIVCCDRRVDLGNICRDAHDRPYAVRYRKSRRPTLEYAPRNIALCKHGLSLTHYFTEYVDHSLLLSLRKSDPEWQPNQTLRDRAGYCESSVSAAVEQSCGRGMQRHIVKDCANSVSTERGEDRLPIDFRRQKHVVHVGIVL